MVEDFHPVAGKIVALLTERDVWFETYEHEPVRTSEEAAKVRPEYTLSEGGKALIVRAKYPGGEKGFVQVVVQGDKKVDVKKVKEVLSLKDIRFATEEEVGEITGGVLPGGVPPFGNLFDIPVLADEGIFQSKKIIFNAGDRSFSIGMKSEDYRDIVKPKVADIVVNE